MPYQRILDLSSLLTHRSLFLFGPRQTGKTTYLYDCYPEARFVDLLEARTFRELSARPELLRLSLTPSDKLIVIDEIQKLPALLDEVHLLIERDKSLRFILTGSSARKLPWVCIIHR
jgi:predicted AAA+ superfamily ATPase